MNKRRRIVTWWQYQADRMIGAFVLVNLHQSLAEGVNGDAHDGVGLGVKD